MGFLDHSTNNVIVDAVLTDEGRRLLATQGTLTPTKFALADDEVDYTLIKKFGRQVGKEKIIKNTPVFEATTNGFLGLKYKLVTTSIATATITRLPILTFSGGDVVGSTLTFTAGTDVTKQLNFIQKMVEENRTIPTGLQDALYTVVLPGKFVTITGQTPDGRDPATGQSFYTKTSSTNSSNFQLQLIRTPTAAEFNEFGSETNKNIIRGTGAVIGEMSGFVLQFSIRIKKDNTVSD